MKRLIYILFGMCVFMPLSLSAKTYDFSHTPANNFRIVKEKEKMGFRYLKYKGINEEIDPLKVDIDVIQNFVKKRGYFNFIKYSYFWVNMFDQLYDGEIDLRFMDEEILEYPVIAVYYLNKIYLFMHEGNFKGELEEELGDYYESMEMTIVKDQEWYVTQIPVGKKEIDSNNIYRPYSYKRYFPVFKSLIRNESTTNFQIGQNPLDEYKITNFSNEFIQIDVVNNDIVKGLILSIKILFEVQEKRVETDYKSQSYVRDTIIYNNIDNLYDAVNDYYKNNGAIPDSIGTMYPRYLDFETLNPYNHKLKFEKNGLFCFVAGFIPNDNEFKQTFKSMLDNEGYIIKNFCIK